MPFISSPRQDIPKGIAYSLTDYCERVDTTGKIIRVDKRTYIEDKNPTLERLSLDSEQGLTLTTEFEQHFTTAAGSEHLMRQFGLHTEHQRMRGIGKAKALLKYA